MGAVSRDRSRRSLGLIVAAILFGLVVTPALADDCRRVQNILVLFDASGNMKERDRYQELLRQMTFFKDAMPLTADGFFNVGLRHYGLKVGLGCNNTESVLPIEPWDPERFINAFPKSISYGVSSLSAGLRAAASDISAASGKGLIILIGAGVESCDVDVVKIADRIGFNHPELEVHTFQVGGDRFGRFNLQEIARKCHGTYTDTAAMRGTAGWHSWMKKYLVVPCQTAPAAEPAGKPKTEQVGPIFFDYNSFTVRSRNRSLDTANLARLEAAGLYLKAHPNARVVLHGFTDGKGGPEYNLKLSRRRAEAVSKFLRNTFGISDTRIGIIAHGEAQDSSRGRAPVGPDQGRRVEFEFFD